MLTHLGRLGSVGRMTYRKLPRRYRRREDQKAHEERVAQFVSVLGTATPEQIDEARAYYALRMQSITSLAWAQDYMAALEAHNHTESRNQ